MRSGSRANLAPAGIAENARHSAEVRALLDKPRAIASLAPSTLASRAQREKRREHIEWQQATWSQQQQRHSAAQQEKVAELERRLQELHMSKPSLPELTLRPPPEQLPGMMNHRDVQRVELKYNLLMEKIGEMRRDEHDTVVSARLSRDHAQRQAFGQRRTESVQVHCDSVAFRYLALKRSTEVCDRLVDWRRRTEQDQQYRWQLRWFDRQRAHAGDAYHRCAKNSPRVLRSASSSTSCLQGDGARVPQLQLDSEKLDAQQLDSDRRSVETSERAPIADEFHAEATAQDLYHSLDRLSSATNM